MQPFARRLIVATLLGILPTGGLAAQYTGLTQWTSGPHANNHWYAITIAGDDFRVLRDLAWRLNGSLVAIGNAAENEFVYSTFFSMGTCAPVWCAPATFYIGLERTSSGGDFAWLTGEPLTFTAWNAGEPNDQGDERVAHMFANGGQVYWNDISYTSNPMRAVIEWEENPTTTIPEPATLLLLATGWCGFAGYARRRRRKA